MLRLLMTLMMYACTCTDSWKGRKIRYRFPFWHIFHKKVLRLFLIWQNTVLRHDAFLGVSLKYTELGALRVISSWIQVKKLTASLISSTCHTSTTAWSFLTNTIDTELSLLFNYIYRSNVCQIWVLRYVT